MDDAIDAGVFEEVRELLLSAGAGALESFAREYLAGSERSLKAIRAGLAAADAAAVERAAHSLRGASANVGARRLCALCRQLEDAARAGKLGGVEGAALAAEGEFARVRRVLEVEAGTTALRERS